MTSEISMREAGHPKPILWDNPEGWVGRKAGAGFRMGDTCTPVAGSCQCKAKPQYCNYPSVKII